MEDATKSPMTDMMAVFGIFISLFAIIIFEVFVALGIYFQGYWVTVAMVLGSVLWVGMTVVAWQELCKKGSKEFSITMLIIFTVVTITSVGGLFGLPPLILVLWLNVVGWFLILAVLTMALLHNSLQQAEAQVPKA